MFSVMVMVPPHKTNETTNKRFSSSSKTPRIGADTAQHNTTSRPNGFGELKRITRRRSSDYRKGTNVITEWLWHSQPHIHRYIYTLSQYHYCHTMNEWLESELRIRHKNSKVVKTHTQMSETHKCICTFAHGHLRERRRGRVILREFN